MKNVFEKNQEVFQNKYHISLFEQMEKYIIENSEEMNIRFSVMDNQEALNESLNCIPKSTLVLVVIGFGNGTFIKSILDQATDKIKIIIWEPDWNVFLYACQRDLSDIILNENVDLIIGSGAKAEDDLERVFSERLDYYNLYHCVIIMLPGFGDKYRAYSKIVETRFNKATFDLRIDVGTRDFFAQINCRNELYAMSIMHQNSIIDKLWERIPTRDIPVIIVSSGPSLKKNVALLKGLESKAIIIAVAHSVKVMYEYEAPMHFAAMLDGSGGAHFMDCDTNASVKMLMGATAIIDLQKKYNGNSIYFSFDQKLFPLSMVNRRYYAYEKGGSVATAMLSMVRSAGFKTVILIGQDLAYDENGFSHAGGEREERKNDCWMEGIDGGQVRVRSDWALFIKSFETEIKEHPDLTVVDATEGGALIHGSIVMPFREAIKKYCVKQYPVSEWIHDLPYNGDAWKSEIEKIILGHYKRVLLTKKRLVEIVEIGQYLVNQCELNLLGATENAYYCERYDQLYNEIINDGTDELTMMYSDDIVQQYVTQAMTLEGDSVVMDRMKLELTLFEGMLNRDKELEAYINELFPMVK